ncbi:hypothetical protein EV426DRAFT_601733 [Tirmania nivea]|nr:hypothetical protein EV426DRAFT_601733 [Tirmania nivea]
MESFRLLDLPLELVEVIALHLEPREAIYLSITCRQLHHGLLSPRNSRLWYIIGNFASGSLPGHNHRWEVSTVMLPELTPSPPQALSARQVILERFLGENAHQPPAPVYIKKEELCDLVKKFPVEPGKPVVDYRRLLVDTMLGRTETGCQWCLRKPDTERDFFFPILKGRVCEECFRFNAIPIGYLELIPSAIEFPASKVQPCPKSANFFDPNGRSVDLLWKSYVNRLVRENYSYPTGPTVELRNVEDERGKKLKGKKMMKTKVFSCRGGWPMVAGKRGRVPKLSGRLSGGNYFRNHG